MTSAHPRRIAAQRKPRAEYTARRKPRAVVVSNKTQDAFNADAIELCVALGFVGEPDWVRDDWSGVTVGDAHRQARRSAHELHQSVLNTDRSVPDHDAEICRRLDVTDESERQIVAEWIRRILERETAEAAKVVTA